MKRNVSLLVILLLWVAVMAPQVFAQSSSTPDVPRVISYQGLLTSSGGQAAADGLHLLTLRLYTDALGTNPAVWSDTFTAETQSGVFSVLLGSKAPLPASSIMAQPLWLSVEVDGVELRPLSELSAAPYALSVPNGSITSEKLGTDYVGSFSINGTKVTGKGSDVNLTAGPGLSLQYDPTTSSILLSSIATGGTGNGKGANPLDLSNNYVQNRTNQQGSANFNIDGSGTIGSNLTVVGTSALQGTTTLGTGAGTTAGTLKINDAHSSDSYTAAITGASQYAANRTYTLPDVGADASFVMSEGAQTINGNKTFGNNITVNGTSALQGAVTIGTTSGTTAGTISFNDANSSTSNSATISGASSYAANRTYTLPDVGANADFVMSQGNQTINGTKTFSDSVKVNGTLTTAHVVATQSIIPQADTTISLGDSNHRFKDLYLSGHSLVMGTGTTQTQFETGPSGGLIITNSSGTTSSATTLSPTGSMTTSGNISTSGALTTGNSIIVNGSTTPRSIWSDATLVLSTDDSLADGGNILIDPAGSVGIGITYPASPDALLEVNGTLHVTGSATFDSDVAFSKSPSLPLHQNRMYYGNASNKATELNSQNSSVLVTDASGQPNWSTTLPSNLSTSGITNTGLVSTTTLSVSGTATLSSGATLGGTLNMGNNPIQNVTDPTSAQDAATKNYVDAQITSTKSQYIHNSTSQQNNSNFNIDGTGTMAGLQLNGIGNATSSTGGIVLDVENTGSTGTALQAGAVGSGNAFAAGNSSSGFAIFATNTGTGGVISANATSGDAIDANVNGGSGVGLLVSSSGSGNAIVAWARGAGNAIAAHGRLDMSGDTIENVRNINNGTGGTITIDGNTDFNNHNLSNLGYVTLNSTSTLSAVSGTLNLASNIDVQNHNIYNVTDPSSAQDAATKHYVDTHTVSAQQGGTGLNTSSTGTGNLLYTSSTGTWSTLSPGSQYKVLTSNGTSSAPSWGTPPGTAVAWGILDANHSGGAAVINGGFNVGSVTTGGGPFYSIAVTNGGSYSHYMVMVSWYGGVGSNMGSVSGNLAGWWDGTYIDIADYVAGGGGTELTPASYISFVLYGY